MYNSKMLNKAGQIQATLSQDMSNTDTRLGFEISSMNSLVDLVKKVVDKELN